MILASSQRVARTVHSANKYIVKIFAYSVARRHSHTTMLSEEPFSQNASSAVTVTFGLPEPFGDWADQREKESRRESVRERMVWKWQTVGIHQGSIASPAICAREWSGSFWAIRTLDPKLDRMEQIRINFLQRKLRNLLRKRRYV